MLGRRGFVSSAGLFAAAAAVTAGFAQNTAQQGTNQKDAAKREKNLESGEAEAKRLLLLMDTDKSGKVSRQEFMAFMETEFDRMDVNKDGELDVKELTQFHVHGGVHR